jgi:hypothetical protein
MRADLGGLAIKRAYVTCFTKQSSLLSQWRGYCPPHRGVSIGFQADDLRTEAEKQRFRLRECLYGPTRQSTIAESLADDNSSHLLGPDLVERWHTMSVASPVAADVTRPGAHVGQAPAGARRIRNRRLSAPPYAAGL